MDEIIQQEEKVVDEIIVDMGHSTLIVCGSPSPDACSSFVKIVSEMKAKQRSEQKRA